MSEMLAESSVEVREQFVCDNDMKAEWCLNKIRRIRAEQKRETEELDKQMQFYMDQKAMVEAKADDEVSFFEGILRGYFNRREEEGFTKEAKTKVSYRLPTGELVLKHREPEYEYKKKQDEAIKFLEKTDFGSAFIKTKKELNWNDLKPFTKVDGNTVVIKETGEVIPGITATEREDEFKVEVKER